jgi:AAA ATPase domain
MREGVISTPWAGSGTAPLTLTPLTGRDTELSLLKDRWEQTQEGMGQVVLVVGQPGLGKSRLVQTLTERMQARVGNASSAEAGESSSASVDQDSPVIEWRCAQRFQNSELHPVSSGRGAASIQYTKCSKRSSLNFERPASKPQCVMYRRGPKWMPPAPTTPEMKQITSGKTIPQWPRRWPPWDWFPRWRPRNG